MGILFIDGGNTSAKWLLCDALSFKTLSSGSFSYEQGCRNIEWLSVDHVYMADVSAKCLACLLVNKPSETAVTEVVSVKSLFGVTNSYHEPDRLGVDRFLSVVEAYNVYATACCVIDIGTAAKVDVVDESGLHLGGYIVPGLAMSEEALLGGTGKVRFEREEVGVETIHYGTDTASAVTNGCLSIMVAWVDKVAENFLKAHSQGRVLITGGGAARVVPHLLARVERVDGLVLHALRRIAKQASE